MIAVILCLILAYAAVFHFYWGLGGKLGIGVSLPQLENGQSAFEHTAMGACLVGLVLAGLIVIVLAFSGFLALPISLSYLHNGIGLFAVLFTMRALSWSKYVGFFKAIRSTRFAKYDSWLYSPLSLLLGVGLALLAKKEYLSLSRSCVPAWHKWECVSTVTQGKIN